MPSISPQKPDLPQVAATDFASADSVIDLVGRLARGFADAGGFDEPRCFTPLQHAIEAEARAALARLTPILDGLTLPLADICRLLPAHDMLHRIAHRRPCPELAPRVLEAVTNQWLRGDKSITQTDLVIALIDQYSLDPSSLPDRHVRYAFDVLDTWQRQLARHGAFPSLPPAEAARRIAACRAHNLAHVS